MINESYKNRIQSLSGLLTESRADIIHKKIGLPKDLSKDIENKYGRYSVWVANSFKEQLIENAKRGELSFKGKPLYEEEFIEYFNSNDEEFLDLLYELFMDYNNRSYSYIHDWLRGRGSGPVIETDKLDFKTLTLPEAHRRAFRWHKELEKIQGGQIKDEEGDVVLTFPDGFYWIRLNKSKCDKEAKAMGHCGTGSGTLFSLRKDKYPYVTTDIDDKGVIQQMRGRANTKPLEKYRKYIYEFLLTDFVSGLRPPYYATVDNFELKDLKKGEIDQIIKTKPQLIKGSKLDFLDEHQTAYIINNHPEHLKIAELFEEEDLTLEKIEELVNDLGWWKNQLQSLGYGSIKRLFNNFTESGQVFYDIILNVLEENEEIFETILYKDILSRGLSESNIISRIKEIKDVFPSIFPKIQNLFLNTSKPLKLFWRKGQLMNYIILLMNSNVFGEKGPKKALKLMQNENVKDRFIKQNSEEDYDLYLQILKDTI